MQKGKDCIGVGVGAAIRREDGRFFLAKRGAKVRNEVGVWEFLGGGLEFGETLEEIGRMSLNTPSQYELQLLLRKSL